MGHRSAPTRHVDTTIQCQDHRCWCLTPSRCKARRTRGKAVLAAEYLITSRFVLFSPSPDSKMPNERSPLLENGHGTPENSERRPFGRRVLGFVKGEGQVGFIQSYRFLFLGSWVNLLLLFIPLSCISHYLKWDAGLRFLFSFLAIIPLAKA
jgi:hypothetical protein